jgi:hypothetical protein
MSLQKSYCQNEMEMEKKTDQKITEEAPQNEVEGQIKYILEN